MTIPQNLSELKDVKQWVNYLRIWNPTKKDGAGGYDKPPINAGTLWNADTTNPEHWTTYDNAAAQIGKTAKCKIQKTGKIITAPIEGCGFVLGSGYCGADFDDVIDDAGNVAPWALEVVERLDTYTEVSPSGNGLHCVLFCGDLLEAGQNFGRQFPLTKDGKPADKENKVSELEIYFYVNGGRYLTVTGNVYIDKPINRVKGPELKKLFEEYKAAADAHKAAQRPLSPVGTHNTTGRAASGDDDRKMIDSALKAIDPGSLVFEEWSAIMTALKVIGYNLNDAEEWSAGNLCGIPNPKNDPKTNARRWNRFHFNKGDDRAAGVIITTARRQGWKPAEAFDDEARREYGRSLYTEEQRKEYGRRKHEERIEKAWDKQRDAFQEWREKRAAGAADPEQSEAVKQPGGEELPTVGTQEDSEPEEITAEEWDASGYYATILTAGDGILEHAEEITAVGYDEYKAAREYLHAEQLEITSQTFQTEAEYFPGLLTYQAGVDIFQGANEEYITLSAFPEFSKLAKIKLHSTVVLAADTGAGKSSLAINFLDQLNDKYPVLYINLEMDPVTILRRLVAIRTGLELDVIEGYQKDEHTAQLVNSALKGITDRKPLQILNDVYTLEGIEKHIQHATKGRKEPTIIFIDHSLLVDTDKKSKSRYDRFTEVSEKLHRMSRKYNVIMFVLLQQNRAGKADAEKRPTNDSLKESGSWENDATHIVFLWRDPRDPAIDHKTLIVTKNRNGYQGDVILNYWPKTQTYKESNVNAQTRKSDEHTGFMKITPEMEEELSDIIG